MSKKKNKTKELHATALHEIWVKFNYTPEKTAKSLFTHVREIESGLYGNTANLNSRALFAEEFTDEWRLT